MKIADIGRLGIAPAVGVGAYFVAPYINIEDSASGLSSFYGTCAQVLATFFIALALLTLFSPIAYLRMREIVGHSTFIFLALGIVAAMTGTIDGLPDCLYRYLFAIALGTGIGAVVAVTRVGIANMKIQRDGLINAIAQALGNPGSNNGPDRGCDSGTKSP